MTLTLFVIGLCSFSKLYQRYKEHRPVFRDKNNLTVYASVWHTLAMFPRLRAYKVFPHAILDVNVMYWLIKTNKIRYYVTETDAVEDTTMNVRKLIIRKPHQDIHSFVKCALISHLFEPSAIDELKQLSQGKVINFKNGQLSTYDNNKYNKQGHEEVHAPGTVWIYKNTTNNTSVRMHCGDMNKKNDLTLFLESQALPVFNNNEWQTTNTLVYFLLTDFQLRTCTWTVWKQQQWMLVDTIGDFFSKDSFASRWDACIQFRNDCNHWQCGIPPFPQ